MSFATALSGLNAASNNLQVTGNNIANANTVGFKQSVAEFADVYASSLSGNSNITPGSGVNVANDAQQFIQGTLQNTSNNLDMAISGSGFFTMAETPTQTTNLTYTRDGEFSLDANGYLVNNQGNALMAYAPNGTSIAAGFSTGVLTPIKINTLTGAPAATTNVNLAINLNANDTYPATQNAIATSGNAAMTAANTLVKAQNTYNLAVAAAGGSTTGATAVADQTALTNAQTAYNSASAAAPAAVTTAVGNYITAAENYNTAYNADVAAGTDPSTDANVTALAATSTTAQNTVASAVSTAATAQSLFSPTDPNTYNNQTSVTIYDSLGSPHILTTYYVKGASTGSTTQWDVYTYMSEPATPNNLTPVNVGTSGTTVSAPTSLTATPTPAVLTFNTSGKLINPASGAYTLSPYTMSPATGAAPINISSLDFLGSTQVQSAFSVNTQTQDGLPAGQLTGISINAEGIISANFSNGGAEPLGQVALSNFANTNGLEKIGNSSWAQSANSGSPILGTAGSNNFGTIQSGAVESSNVNLSSELVNLIIAQQTYQANAKTISTQNQIMQSILQI
jgi:flagellar hook-basal body protein